jgi:hypothetical protein
LEVKRSGYYRWVKKMNDIDLIYSKTIEKVKEIAKAAENVYGSRIVKHALNSLSYPVSRLKERQLMNDANTYLLEQFIQTEQNFERLKL